MTDLRKAAELALEALERSMEADRQARGEPVAWRDMKTAPKDGTAVLVLIPDSDIPKAVRWRNDCWEMTWDGHQLSEYDQPRYWMPCPSDPDCAPQPQQTRPTDDDLWDKTLSDRDHYHDMADKLAEAIAAHFGVDIGEHSSANCPWEMALEVIESAQQIPEGYKAVPPSKQEPVAWTLTEILDKRETTTNASLWFVNPVNSAWTPLYTAPPSKPDDLLRQSEQEGWRWARECEAEVKRLRTLLAEGGQGCAECGVTVSEGYALYCVKCVEPLFKKEWVSLTDEEIENFDLPDKPTVKEFVRFIEAALRSKNHG